MVSKSRRKEEGAEKSVSQQIITSIPAIIQDGKGEKRDTHLERSERDAAIRAYGTPGASWSHRFRSARHATRVYDYLIGKGLDSFRIGVSGGGKTLNISGPHSGAKGGEPNEFKKVHKGGSEAGLSPQERLETANKFADELISGLKAKGMHAEAETISEFRKDNWRGQGEVMLPFSFYSKARMIQGYLEDTGNSAGRIALSMRRGRMLKEYFTLSLSAPKKARIMVARETPGEPSRIPRLLTSPERKTLDALWERSTRNVADKIGLLEATATTLGNDSPKGDLEGFMLQYRGLYELAEKNGPDSASINRSLGKLAQLRFAVEGKLMGKKNVRFPGLAGAEEFASK